MPVAPPKPTEFPLNALRAFEAAGRLEGFSAAAAELGVTPGAVTAQVKLLEDMLGDRLFQRGPKGVVLTPFARRCLPKLSDAFDALAEASRTLREEAAPKVVHIATLPSIAQLWLSPRLPELRQAAPEVQISITALEAPANLKRSAYDLNLFFRREDNALPIQRDVIFPVCAPELARRVQTVDDLDHVPCISDATWVEDWGAWLSSFAANRKIVPRGPVYSLYALAVEEALNGAGVLMAHGPLVARHLAAGRLVRLFEGQLELPGGLCLWSDRKLRPDKPAGRVAQWLHENAA